MNLGESPILGEEVQPDNEFKSWLVDYVGNKNDPDSEEVTVEMIVQTMSEQFPEFLMAVAEENWIRGYHQALADVEEGEEIFKKESHESEENG